MIAALSFIAAAALNPIECTVMTFNVRNGAANDGPNRWEIRKSLVAEVVRKENPDFVGLQEAFDYQVDYLLANLSGYKMVGVGRDDGKRKGEFSAILYKHEKYEVNESGTSWLSDTPDAPGSKSWGNNIPRIYTWAEFEVKTGGELTVVNTHWDHQSQESRMKSAEAIVARFADTERFVLMGDFNAGVTNPAYEFFRGSGLTDVYQFLHHSSTEPEGTFTGFDPKKTDGERIDHIFCDPGVDVKSARIVRWSFGGRLPSDHFPVVARLWWRGEDDGDGAMS